MDEKIKIERGSVQETLIIPLYARKKCTDKFPRLYSDPVGAEIYNRLDYDFSELDRKYESTAYEFGAMEGALRQMDMMWEIEDYIAFHPEASIVCLGCGLDTDPRRCGNKGNRIYNVDFPDVIAAREELAGVDEREINIAGDLTDHAWMDQIDGSGGTLFYAAGVFHYIYREDVRKLVLEIMERFPDARLLFDTVGKRGYKIMMKSVLKNHNMSDFGDRFYTDDAVGELSGWSDRIRVTSKGYMLGYYDMRAPGVRGIHRLLARIGDSLMKMRIVRMETK